jgi:hypothetical protein
MFADTVLPTMNEDDFQWLETKLMHITHEDMIPMQLRFLLPRTAEQHTYTAPL